MKRLISIAGTLLILATLLIALVWSLTGCGDDSTIVEPAPPESKDYVVWMHNMYRPQELLGYHPIDGRIDTLVMHTALPEPLEAISSSADGSLIYGVLRFDSIAVVSSTDGSLLRWLPFSTQETVYPSPNGQYLAIVNQNLTVLTASDYQIVFSDTSRIPRFCRFSADSKYLYAVAVPDPYSQDYVYQLNLATEPFSISRISTGYPRLSQILPTLDRSQWLLYLVEGSLGGFVIYDTLLDSAVFEHYLYPGLGMLAITPDGRWAFYTNPGGGIFPLGESIIRVFDIENNRIDEEIVTNLHGDTTAPTHCPIQEMVVTPDGRYLVGTTYPSPNQLICYDIVKRELIDYIYFGEGTLISNLTVQQQP